MTETLAPATRIDAQFNGPNHSGNGGYVAGTVAARLGQQVATVDLRTPPPLDQQLSWSGSDDHVDLLDGAAVVASARSSSLRTDDPLVAPIDLDTARAGRDAYEGLHDHPFPRCFTCGAEREPGDGLRVFSGPLPDGRTGCPWEPHERFGDAAGLLAPEFMWAALDCPGGWAAGIKQTPMVLGRMTAQLIRRPRVGEPCIAIGALRDVVRRKHSTATALYTTDGELLGRADQVWIAIDIAEFS